MENMFIILILIVAGFYIYNKKKKKGKVPSLTDVTVLDKINDVTTSSETYFLLVETCLRNGQKLEEKMVVSQEVYQNVEIGQSYPIDQLSSVKK
ncbi:hypothetical protein [Vagococcus silagei]|uniref:Uncharacterized protein n=1 Tax=Vagococcus silagei TaxID=2508885 RepID=A0A4V3TV56_9ENTE|nr:hypothetical protein [Vagococcus silagei]THB61559.1 hypothetical protein ESZ54_04890 [Vagococcus silagei]